MEPAFQVSPLRESLSNIFSCLNFLSTISKSYAIKLFVTLSCIDAGDVLSRKRERPRLCSRSVNFVLHLPGGRFVEPGTTKRGKYHCTVDLLFDWFGISCLTTDNFCFYLQNRLIQTSQTGGQRYNDTSPFSIPWLECLSLVGLYILVKCFQVRS